MEKEQDQNPKSDNSSDKNPIHSEEHNKDNLDKKKRGSRANSRRTN